MWLHTMHLDDGPLDPATSIELLGSRTTVVYIVANINGLVKMGP